MISNAPLCPTCISARPQKGRTIAGEFPHVSSCDFKHRIGVLATTGVYECHRYTRDPERDVPYIEPRVVEAPERKE